MANDTTQSHKYIFCSYILLEICILKDPAWPEILYLIFTANIHCTWIYGPKITSKVNTTSK